MATLLSSSFPLVSAGSSRDNRLGAGYSKSTVNVTSSIRTRKSLIGNQRLTTRIATVDDLPTAADAEQVQISWEIIVGAVAGVAPFAVAGIEFSKRIRAQRRCETCGGSGLVLMRNEEYVRCPACGGFLPWQSWKRFFFG